MKSLLSVCLVAGSALVAGSSINAPYKSAIPAGESFFTCTVDGKTFMSIGKDSSLATVFTYTDDKHLIPAALFINAGEKQDNFKTGFYIQPLEDGAPSAALTAHNNLYQQFYITYKAPDNHSYNTTTAPGNFEITSINRENRTVTGKLNCILYSSTRKDWLVVTNGRFRLKF